MSDLAKVVKNYEGPSPSDKGRVLDDAYKSAKNFVEALEREKLTQDVRRDTQHDKDGSTDSKK